MDSEIESAKAFTKAAKQWDRRGLGGLQWCCLGVRVSRVDDVGVDEYFVLWFVVGVIF